jgi:hypothetical protein
MTYLLSCKTFFYGNRDVSRRRLGINCNVEEVGSSYSSSEKDPERNPEQEKLLRLRSVQKVPDSIGYRTGIRAALLILLFALQILSTNC